MFPQLLQITNKITLTSKFSLISCAAFNFLSSASEIKTIIKLANMLTCNIIILASFKDTVFSQLNAPGVYFKLGLVDPAFNRGPAFINGLQFSVNFSNWFIVTDLRDQGAVCQGGTIFLFVVPRKTVPRYPKLIITTNEHYSTLNTFLLQSKFVTNRI